jgi:hypothetical protein
MQDERLEAIPMTYKIHVATDKPNALCDYYLIAKLAWHWKRVGHVVTAGPVGGIDPGIDLAIFHVDRTRVDPDSVPGNPAGRPFLNSRVLDISKHLFSLMRVMPGDPWKGSVIVKSDLNAFGSQEWDEREHSFFERKRRRLARRHWKLARSLPPRSYPVLPSISAVPGWVWRHPDIIVERFVPQMNEGLYCLQGWVFFGKRGYTYRMYSTDPVVKAGSIMKAEFLGDPPPELEAFREANGWDFGKFDYVEVDGKHVLLDINKTPSITTGPDTPRLRDLAMGIEDTLGGSR